MGSINKIQVDQTTHDISPSPHGTLDGYYVSDDCAQEEAQSYQSTDTITTEDNNCTIFNKFTKMVRNVRYLYNLTGSEDLQGYTITRALQILSDKIDSLENRVIVGSTFTTSVDCGGIPSGTEIQSDYDLSDVVKAMLGHSPEPSEYESRDLGIWSSLADVEAFLAEYNPENNWDGIKLGNYVTINDGTYNAVWVVAGIDLENNGVAYDGTEFDNGRGLCLIPKTSLVSAHWNDSDTIVGGYYGSVVHTFLNGTVYDNLSSVLGSHIVNRNVCLTSECNGAREEGSDHSEWATNSVWTTAHLTLLSSKQVLNDTTDRFTGMDTGEANYYLPLFDYEESGLVDWYWLRNIYGRHWYEASDGENSDAAIYCIAGNGTIDWSHIHYIDEEHEEEGIYSRPLRPMMYIR